MKKILSFFAAVLFAGSMMAGVVTLDPSTQEAVTAESDINLTIEGIGVAYHGVLNTENAPADFRVYGGKSLKLTADVNITKVVIAGKANKAGFTANVDHGTVTTGASYSDVTEKADLNDPLVVIEDIDNKSVTLTAGKQLRAYMIEVTFEGESTIEPGGYYLAGSMNNWAPAEAYKFVANPKKTGEFMLTTALAVNDEFKVAYSADDQTFANDNWYPQGMGNNFVVTEEFAGDKKTIYFNPDKGEGWEQLEGYIYLEENKEPGEEVEIDVDYVEVGYYTESGTNYWQINLYKDYDETTEVVTYPDLYIGIPAANKKAIAGTYTADDILFIELDTDEETALDCTATSDLVITRNDDGTYTYECTFADEDENTYVLNVTLETYAYDGTNNYAEITLDETGGEGGEGGEGGSITTCAEAREAALSVSGDNVEYNNGATYTVKGYVTGIKTAWNSQYKNVSFWMADTKDGGDVIQAYRAVCENEADAPKVGDKVSVTGKLTKYGSTPEFAAGCTFVILESGADPVNLGEKTIAEFLSLKNKVDTCILTGTVKNIKMDSQDDTKYNAYGNFDLEDETGSVYIYGLLTAAGENKKFNEMGIDEGDVITLKGVYAEYNGDPQVQNAVFVKLIKKGTAVDNVTVDTKTVKVIENGTLIIIKNGTRFNAVGQIVR